MRTIKGTNQYKRDYKRTTKGKSKDYVCQIDIDLAAVLEVLAADQALATRYEDHPLSNDWKGCRECHVRPDLLLVYSKPDRDTLVLVRLGSHAELFG
jgi:mRNA interferase YafQ